MLESPASHIAEADRSQEGTRGRLHTTNRSAAHHNRVLPASRILHHKQVSCKPPEARRIRDRVGHGDGGAVAHHALHEVLGALAQVVVLHANRVSACEAALRVWHDPGTLCPVCGGCPAGMAQQQAHYPCWPSARPDANKVGATHRPDPNLCLCRGRINRRGPCRASSSPNDQSKMPRPHIQAG